MEEAILFISRNSCQKQPEEIRKGKNIFEERLVTPKDISDQNDTPCTRSEFSETMVAMEHVEFARSLALFLMIYLLICNGNFGALATQAAPSVSLPSVVETLPGHEVTFSVNGTLPLNTTVMKNSTVLFTGVESAAALIFHEEGKFTCMARNSFGSYFKEFSVIFGDCGPDCSSSRSDGRNFLSCVNVAVMQITPCLVQTIETL
ncbi:uncharacterized protein [Pocillopora verrucosa]|uniref:uncharacterized protein n=1 Tax=Pocillopora verrucosa TaxID=203993 RepID=UPI00333FFD7F